MTCHNPQKSFTELPRSKRKDRDERRFVCRECGQHWQYSGTWYQVSVPQYGEAKKQYAITMPPSVYAAIKKDHGGQQAYLEKCLKRDGYL